MFNRNKMKFVLTTLVVSSLWLVTTPASAKHRKLPGVTYCTSNTYWTTNTGNGSSMYGVKSVNNNGSTYTYTACSITSDSYFEHEDINLVNVHVYVVSGSVYARICIHNPMNNAVDCSNFKNTSGATGERVLSFEDTYLQKLKDYPGLNPFVEVTTNQNGNYIRGVWVTE